MLSAISNINSYQNNNYKPAFGSVILSRVVLRTVDKNGDVFYTPLMNNEKGIVGIYQSLSKRVNGSKNMDFLKKLKEAIPDFSIKNPIIHSTIIGVRSSFKRFLLTGRDAKNARDLGTDLIGALANKKCYAETLKNKILYNPTKRVLNAEGDEIGIDLIVEGQKGKRKLVDIEINTLQGISKAKPPKYASNNREIKKLDKIELPKQKEPTKQLREVQQEFDFLNQLEEPKPNVTDFD